MHRLLLALVRHPLTASLVAGLAIAGPLWCLFVVVLPGWYGRFLAGRLGLPPGLHLGTLTVLVHLAWAWVSSGIALSY